MILDRQKLTQRVLADWNVFRSPIQDNDELAQLYAEMTGYFASTDPIAFSEFVAGQRKRKRTRR